MHRKIKELIKDILPAGVLITILGLIFVLKVHDWPCKLPWGRLRDRELNIIIAATKYVTGSA